MATFHVSDGSPAGPKMWMPFASRRVCLCIEPHSIDYVFQYAQMFLRETDQVVFMHCSGLQGEDYKQALATMLQPYVAAAKEAKMVPSIVDVEGEPREALTDAIEAGSFDTVIVGSRGLSAMKRAFLGSVSTHLVHHVSCPVVVVKNPKEAKTA